MRSVRLVTRIWLFGVVSLAWGGTSARGDFLTTLSVGVSPQPDDLFLYNYTLLNQADSDLSAVALSLGIGPQADLRSITGPTGWDIAYSTGDPLISWESSDTAFDLPPGSSEVFSFISPLGPTSGDYLIVGLDETTFRVETNQGQTVGPGTSAVPEPSTLLLCGIGLLWVLGYKEWTRHPLRRHKRAAREPE